MSDHDDFGAFLIGFVVGGVAGAVAALLLAPQSGEETRALIKDKSIELRDMATQQADLVSSKTSGIAEEAKTRGMEAYENVRTRGKETVDSVKKAVARKHPTEDTGS